MRIPSTPICVDKFRFIGGVSLYFLTHLHADHTEGITPTWNWGTILCSPITKRLLIQKFDVDPRFVKVLEVGETHVLRLPNDNYSPEQSEFLNVTVIDANHCPGAVMFLFEGYFGRVLHTGDFRYCGPMVENLEHALSPGIDVGGDTNSEKRIDVVYLDNTYCHPDFESLLTE
eukprot:886234_1